ncbi:MAG: hypothetical protein O7D28_05505 [Actinobacteria bacterium]|nr:hypothetical protein [Actinomycetota bacterium]
MADIEPVESEDKKASVWTVVAVVVGAVALLGVPACLSTQSVVGSETTTTVAGAATTSITLPVTNPTEQPSTTVRGPEENPFIGWWKATDVDGSLLDLRVDAEGMFFFWDSASGGCRNSGLEHSPETWGGTATLEMTDRPSFVDDMVGEGALLVPTLTVSGTVTCYPYGADKSDVGDRSLDFYYDPDTDMLEPGSGAVRYGRSPAVPGVPADAANPFVGSWEATDADGTHIVMTILADGSWEATDARSAGCERKGFTYATWSGEGSGTFNLSSTPVFELELTTYCDPPELEKVVHSPEVNWSFEFQQSSDTVVLLADGTTYIRLP